MMDIDIPEECPEPSKQKEIIEKLTNLQEMEVPTFFHLRLATPTSLLKLNGGTNLETMLESLVKSVL